MNPLIEEVLRALQRAGWTVKLASSPRPLPPEIAARHPNPAPLAVEFFTHVDHCVSDNEGRWLLAAEDFAGTAGKGFRWDEFEQMTLDGAEGKLASATHAFWDGHLPVLLVVDADYEFLALGTDRGSKHFGKVVWAELVDFEFPLVEAESYEDLLIELRDIARAGPASTAGLARFVHTAFIGDEVAKPGSLWRRLRRWLGD